MKVNIHQFRLNTRKVFTTAHGSARFRNSMVVELVHDGMCGYGEATEILYYGKNIDRMILHVKKHKDWIESLDLLPPTMQYQRWYDRFKEDLFVLCAIDIAYHDLWGKLKGKQLKELWQFDIAQNVVSSLTVGLDTVDGMINHINQNPWPIYKIKLGSENDMMIILSIRKITNAPLRVDVNAGWSKEQTIRNAPLLKELDIEYIEQPLPQESWDDMEEVFDQAVLPFIADESCHTLEDVTKCVNRFHGINIKLMKCGGLTPALQMIALARKLNLKIMIGCMTETSIGISALGQLLPLVDYADMDGSLLISNDPARGVYLENGVAIYPEIAGIGAELLVRNEV